MQRDGKKTDDERGEGKRRSRRGLLRNRQVVVVLQERGRRELTTKSEGDKERERERAAQPAESRLPLKGIYLHSQHTSTNDKCRRRRGVPLTGYLSAERMDRQGGGGQCLWRRTASNGGEKKRS